MTDEQKKERIEFMKELAFEAGEIMKEHYFGEDMDIQEKSDQTPVTIADTKINRMVIERIQEKYPGEGIIGEEESTTSYQSNFKWICDPIDGTRGFILKEATAMFSLGIVADNQPIIGVAYEPVFKNMYWAAKGMGAFKNGERIFVSEDELEKSDIGIIGNPYKIRKMMPYLEDLLDLRCKMAVFSGAVSKCVRVAEGSFTCFIDEYLNPHDVAASHIIVEEAGGIVTDPFGDKLDYSKPFKGAIVCNKTAHSELINIMKVNFPEGVPKH